MTYLFVEQSAKAAIAAGVHTTVLRPYGLEGKSGPDHLFPYFDAQPTAARRNRETGGLAPIFAGRKEKSPAGLHRPGSKEESRLLVKHVLVVYGYVVVLEFVY
jgi:hypothetical protein